MDNFFFNDFNNFEKRKDILSLQVYQHSPTNYVYSVLDCTYI